MARFFPDLKDIPKLRQKPTEGELHLLNFFANNLDDSYEVYFQPFINGDRPDVILVRPDAGVMIIEVKDWHLKHYKLDAHKNWLVTQNGQDWSKIKSPLSQVITYKENLYELNIEHLLERLIKNSKMFAVVTCAVYFHNETRDSLYNFLTNDFQNEYKYLKFIHHQELLGSDSLTPTNFQAILRKRYLHRSSNLFDETLYTSFKRHLQPPLHTKEEGKPLTYTKKQSELSASKPKHQKIKGVAGSGKTYVLAKRAVNALKRIQDIKNYPQPSILILTYNITLKNYIHDRISEIREDFAWKSFYITNYHDFIKAELNNLGIKLEPPEDFDNWESEERTKYFEDNWYGNLNLFQQYQDQIKGYPVIFIDEIQDYQENWVKIIRDCFLHKDGEYIALGDEKQNIYERIMDAGKKPFTGIGGEWNKLDSSFRLSSRIARLATEFQRYFFQEKYEIDDIQVVEQPSLFDKQERIEYIPVDNASCESLYRLIDERAENYSIHPNDICIQSSKIEILRYIDLCARVTRNQKTTTTFETQEIYLKLLMKFNANNKEFQDKISFFKFERIDKPIDTAMLALRYSYFPGNSLAMKKLREYLEEKGINIEAYQNWAKDMLPLLRKLARNQEISNRLDNELDKVRKYKKFNYWMNSGKVKLSTIHSFKGWEVDTLFLIIEDEPNTFTTDELIYTALTRCRHNLFILDCGKSRYASFFNTALTS